MSLKTASFEDYPKLIDGLRKLNKSDPSLEVYAQENGDVILVTCGETHLERCIRDLEDTLAKVKIVCSEPLVSFRETVVYQNIIEINNPIKKITEKATEIMRKQEFDKENEDEKEEFKKDYGENAEIFNISEEKPEKDEMRFNEEHSRKKQEQKDAFLKQVSQLPKKIDKKNKAKSQIKINKMNLINLNKRSNVFETFTANKRFNLKVRAVGLKFEFAEFLEKNANLMRKLFYNNDNKQHHGNEIKVFLNEMLIKMKEFCFEEKFIELLKNSLISFGPKRCGPNLLLIKGLNPEDSLFDTEINRKIAENEDPLMEEEKNMSNNKTSSISSNKKIKDCDKKELLLEKYLKTNANTSEINKALIAGFEMSVSAGPLCEEPMMGVCFIVESFKPVEEEKKEDFIEKIGKNEGELKMGENSNKKDDITIIKNEEENLIGDNIDNIELKEEKLNFQEILSKKSDKSEKNEEKKSKKSEKSEKTEEKKAISMINPDISKDLYGPLSGQIMSSMKDACCESFLGAMPRLAEGVYQCNLLTDSSFYGKSYEVLNKRRATILTETLNENSNIFNIIAHLPIQESFGFYSEILNKTSGRVNAQLVFDTWKILEVDPFFCPQTEQVYN